jgi:hypothetical protein
VQAVGHRFAVEDAGQVLLRAALDDFEGQVEDAARLDGDLPEHAPPGRDAEPDASAAHDFPFFGGPTKSTRPSGTSCGTAYRGSGRFRSRRSAAENVARAGSAEPFGPVPFGEVVSRLARASRSVRSPLRQPF